MTVRVAILIVVAMAGCGSVSTRGPERPEGDEVPGWLLPADACPADVMPEKEVPFAARAGCKGLEACMEGCRAGTAMACYVAAGLVEEQRMPVAKALFLRACRLGITSGCTNRAAEMRVLEAGRPETGGCTARTFEQTCARQDPWGCTMFGWSLMVGDGIAKDVARAREVLPGGCRLDEDDEACKKARELLKELDGKARPEDFPLVQGDYQLTKDWAMSFREPVRRRFEDGAMIFWRPGFTVLVTVWNDPTDQAERRKQLEADASPQRYDLVEESDGGLLRFSYRLDEPAEDRRRPAFYGFVVGARSSVQIAVYFDDEKDLAEAAAVWRSLVERPPT
jgi:hypothetical protein